MSDDCSKKCCEPKKKIFQGKVYIPDDHIQLISKYFQGANLNLNFAVDDEESDKDCRKKKRKTRSRSRKRKSRKRKTKRCKCCKCHEDKCEVPKSRCCGTTAKHGPTPARQTCCTHIDAPAPTRQTCCAQIDPCATKPTDCCEVSPDPCKERATVTNTICCCEKPPAPEPEKRCCCCGRPCVQNDNETEKAKKKGEGKARDEEEDDDNDDDDRIEEDRKNEKKTLQKKRKKKQPPLKFTDGSSESSSSKGGNVKQVYVAEKLSSLENDKVYGRYWYHRPPLENTITHCDDYDFLGPSASRTDGRYRNSYRNDQRPCEDGGPCDGRPSQTNPAYYAFNAQYSETGDRNDRLRHSAGRCMACKEPICLICKMNVCECDCEKPNFVICNPCKHRLTPKPPKKPCPPKTRKPRPQQDNGGCDEAMFLLPLLASMHGNKNVQQCCC